QKFLSIAAVGAEGRGLAGPLDALDIAAVDPLEVETGDLLDRSHGQARQRGAETVAGGAREGVDARGGRFLGGPPRLGELSGGEREEPGALSPRPGPKSARLPLARIGHERGADRAPKVLGIAGEELALDRHRRELSGVDGPRVVQGAEEA